MTAVLVHSAPIFAAPRSSGGGTGHTAVLDWFEHAPDALLLLAHDGRLAGANAVARGLLEEGLTVRVSDGLVLAGATPLADLAPQDGSRAPVCLGSAGDVTTWALFSRRVATSCLCEIRCVPAPGGARSVGFDPAFHLTRSERRVVEQLLSHTSIEAIGESLNISVETVRTHRKRAFAKLGVGSRFELAALVLDALL